MICGKRKNVITNNPRHRPKYRFLIHDRDQAIADKNTTVVGPIPDIVLFRTISIFLGIRGKILVFACNRCLVQLIMYIVLKAQLYKWNNKVFIDDFVSLFSVKIQIFDRFCLTVAKESPTELC